MTVKTKGTDALLHKKILPISELLVVLSLFIMLKLSDTVSAGAWSGLVLTAGTILPSVFPFMVLGDFLSCYISNNGLGFFEGLATRTLRIERQELGIAIGGLLCGFPSSARAVSEAYSQKRIDEDSAIRLCALTSNPSPAFIIGAIGAGLFGNAYVGSVLFLSLLISVISASLLFGKKRQKRAFPDIIAKQKYSFVESVKRAGMASVTVFSFVTLFCTLIEILKHFIGGGVLFSLLVTTLEVSTALVHLLTACNLPRAAIYALVGFSIGFGGLCANLQCAAFLGDAGLGLKKFFIIKLTLGALCALFSLSLLSFFK